MTMMTMVVMKGMLMVMIMMLTVMMMGACSNDRPVIIFQCPAVGGTRAKELLTHYLLPTLVARIV